MAKDFDLSSNEIFKQKKKALCRQETSPKIHAQSCLSNLCVRCRRIRRLADAFSIVD